MATFIVVPIGQNAEIGRALSEKFENKAFELPRGEWLVSYDGTSRQLSEHVGISTPEGPGEMGSALVLNFSGYWGLASKDVWEWLKEHGD